MTPDKRMKKTMIDHFIETKGTNVTEYYLLLGAVTLFVLKAAVYVALVTLMFKLFF